MTGRIPFSLVAKVLLVMSVLMFTAVVTDNPMTARAGAAPSGGGAAKSQSITFRAVPDTPWNASAPVLDAKANSGLAVWFDSSSSGAICAVTHDGVVTLDGPGTCSITAHQDGDASYTAATPVTKSFTVTKAAQTISFTQGDAAIGSGPVTLSASATSALAVTFSTTTPSICSTTASSVTLKAVGSCSITASQAGDERWSAAPTVTRTFAVLPDSQTITFAAPANAAWNERVPTLDAHASSGLPITYSSKTSKGICTVSAEGQIALFGPGECTITASQAGNAIVSAAPDVTRAFTVDKASQTISFTLPAGAALSGSAPALAATSDSGLTVTYRSNSPAVCSVSGNGGLTLLAVGTCSITASQGGDRLFSAATDVTRVVDVARAEQSVTFSAALIASVVDDTWSPRAKGGESRNPVMYSIDPDSSTICSIESGVVRFHRVGGCTVVAEQAGNETFSPARATHTVIVQGKPRTISFIAPQDAPWDSGPISVTATSSNGSVAFISESLPNCTVNGSGDAWSVQPVSPGSCVIKAQLSADDRFASQEVTRTFRILKTDLEMTITPSSDKKTVTLTTPRDLKVQLWFAATGSCTIDPTQFTDDDGTASVLDVEDDDSEPDDISDAAPQNHAHTSSVKVALNEEEEDCSISVDPKGSRFFTRSQWSRTINQVQTIEFERLQPLSWTSKPPTLRANATSGKGVKFVSLTTSVCRIRDLNGSSQLRPVGKGDCTIVASQEGEPPFWRPASIEQTVTIGAGGTVPDKNGQVPELRPGTSEMVLPDGSVVPVDIKVRGNGTIAMSDGIVEMTLGGRDSGKTRTEPNGRITFERGSPVVSTGTGFLPNSTVYFWLFSTPKSMGSVETDEYGNYTFSFFVPADLEVGSHTIQATGVGSDELVRTMNAGVEVAEPVRAVAKSKSTAQQPLDNPSEVSQDEAVGSVRVATVLPQTGTDTRLPFTVGLVLFVSGGAVALFSRRRRLVEPDANV